MGSKVFIFPIPNALTLMNIGLPFHVFEQRYRKMVHDAISDNVPIAVTPPTVDYRGRVFAAGVPEVIQKYPDGRMDILLKGEIKGKIDSFLGEDPYKVFSYHELHENMTLTANGKFQCECLAEAIKGWAAKQIYDQAQLDLFHRVIEDKNTLVGYATLFLVERPDIRQKILDQQCIDKKIEMILKEWGPKEISLGPYLAPIKLD